MISATTSHGRLLFPSPPGASHLQRPSISARSEILSVRQTVTRRIRLTAKYKWTKMREEKLSEMIEEKVTEVCEENERSDECRVAWDVVEEVSQAKADLRKKLKLMNHDPLESFCKENPETDECRIESMKIKRKNLHKSFGGNAEFCFLM